MSQREKRLSTTELAIAADAEVARVNDIVERGLITPASFDGSFETGDVSRVRLLLALERSGIALDDLAAAVRDGRLSLAFAGQVLFDPVGPGGRTHAEVTDGLGLDPSFVESFQLALGLPAVSGDAPIREDDAELFGVIAAARAAGLDDESLLRVFRVFGINVRQIVEVQRELFRERVEAPLLEDGVPVQSMLDATSATRLRLQQLGFRAIFLLLRRFLEAAVFENLVARIEAMLAEQDISVHDSARFRTIVFIDLSGFTALTIEDGDERAAEFGRQLLAVALDRAGAHQGRVVKTMGDGVMLVFPKPGPATRTALEIVAGAVDRGLPPARAGIATGPVIQRDGDFFGTTVNLAARLLDHARPGQVLTTGRVAELSENERLAFASAGAPTLKGFDEPTPIFSAETG